MNNENLKLTARREVIPAKYTFTDIEKVELAQELARTAEQADRLEEERKSINSDYKSRIEMGLSKVKSLSTKITSGFEMRDTECDILFDAKAGTKTFVNSHTEAIVKVEGMSPNDYQMHFPNFRP